MANACFGDVFLFVSIVALITGIQGHAAGVGVQILNGKLTKIVLLRMRWKCPSFRVSTSVVIAPLSHLGTSKGRETGFHSC
uniref:Putative secreted protein n=1 Tax=Anopheles darlingi TaxID=43151 RepID=A0A2M4DCK2_ANODA